MKENDLSSGRLTGIRREVKYLIDAGAGAEVLSKLKERIPPKLVNGAPSSYRISIYLDTADRNFSKTELDAEQLRTKMRVRDYYLLSEDRSPLFGPSCFVEVKNVTMRRGTAPDDPVEFPDAVTAR